MGGTRCSPPASQNHCGANKSVFFCCTREYYCLAKYGLFEFQCQHALLRFARFQLGLHTVNMMRDLKGYERIRCWFRFVKLQATKLIQTMDCVYLHCKCRWGLHSHSSVLSRVLKPCRTAVLGICSTLISIFIQFLKLAPLDWFSSSHPVPVATRPHQLRRLHVF